MTTEFGTSRSFVARFSGGESKLEAARVALENGAREGIAPLRVAVYGIPDTRVPAGLAHRQVIDPGAFRTVIARFGTSNKTVPYLTDHGNAHMTGFISLDKKVGYADNFRETPDGMDFDAHYNLMTTKGREAFADLLFDPDGIEVSFRSPPDEVTYMGNDGYEHVREFTDLIEVSQVARGAQALTGLVGTVSARENGGEPPPSDGTAASDPPSDADTDTAGSPPADGGDPPAPPPGIHLGQVVVDVVPTLNDDDLLKVVLAKAHEDEFATALYQGLAEKTVDQAKDTAVQQFYQAVFGKEEEPVAEVRTESAAVMRLRTWAGQKLMERLGGDPAPLA